MKALPSGTTGGKYTSDDDGLVLEDGTNRVRLEADPGRVKTLVSGVIAAVRGFQSEIGDFAVQDMCFMGACE